MGRRGPQRWVPHGDLLVVVAQRVVLDLRPRRCHARTRTPRSSGVAHRRHVRRARRQTANGSIRLADTVRARPLATSAPPATARRSPPPPRGARSARACACGARPPGAGRAGWPVPYQAWAVAVRTSCAPRAAVSHHCAGTCEEVEHVGRAEALRRTVRIGQPAQAREPGRRDAHQLHGASVHEFGVVDVEVEQTDRAAAAARATQSCKNSGHGPNPARTACTAAEGGRAGGGAPALPAVMSSRGCACARARTCL
jgi:hypothetical protein